MPNNDLASVSLFFCTSGRPTTTTSDRPALVALYHATGGPSWQNNLRWLSDAPIDEWHGVVTDPSGRVTELNLGNNRLSGEIPPDLGNLPHLQVLILHGNTLSGRIPPDLGRLANLQVLILHANELSGRIPPALGNLANLQVLSLGVNGRLGAPSFGGIRLGVVSSRGGNELSGEIPAALGGLASLTRLYLSENALSGEIPPELGSLAHLDSAGPLRKPVERTDTARVE